MKKLCDLVNLEKSSSVNFRYCEIIAMREKETDDGAETVRILRDGERYFYHEMKNGDFVQCFEIALSWEPFENVKVFAFTPDNLHVWQFETRKRDNSRVADVSSFEVMKLDENLIVEGMACKCLGVCACFESDCMISINGKSVKVKPCYDFVYCLQKSQIKAIGGAAGLYRFLENIAENSRVCGYATLQNVFTVMKEKYCKEA